MGTVAAKSCREEKAKNGTKVHQEHDRGPRDVVERMWKDERIVVKHLSEPGLEAIRISFWALHEESDIDRLADAFARTLAARVR